MTDMLSDRIRSGSEAAPWVVESVKKLEAENTELKQKLAAGYTAVASGINADLNTELTTAKATIESLNLRVARLVDALKMHDAWHKEYGDENLSGYTKSEMQIATEAALSSDSQWLRDKIATELKTKS